MGDALVVHHYNSLHGASALTHIAYSVYERGAGACFHAGAPLSVHDDVSDLTELTKRSLDRISASTESEAPSHILVCTPRTFTSP